MIQLKSDFKILITRTDRIGDLVLSTPVFDAVKKKYPKAFLSVLTFVENREIIEAHPAIDEIILYDKKGIHCNFFGNLKLSQEIRRKKFDLVIHLHATNRMHLLTWLAGVPVRVGWDRRLPWALTTRIPYEKKNGEKHEAYYNFIPLSFIGVPEPVELETFFSVTERSECSVEEFLKQYGLEVGLKAWVVINPAASGPEKMWPIHKFSRLIKEIKKRYDVEVFLIGARNDRCYVDEIRKEVGACFYDFSGRFSLGMLGAFLRKCDLMISNDSGPVHVAQAVGLFTLSIFVREAAGLSSKRWGPVGEHSVTLSHLPVEVDDVLRAIEESQQLNRGACL